MSSFKPDGVYGGTPYRVLPDGSIEAMLPVGPIKFDDIDQFIASASDAAGDLKRVPSILPSISPRDANASIPASTEPLDYYSILLGVIKKADQSSAQRRALVYEWARFNLKRDVLYADSSMRLTDVVRNLTKFELAVARIEADAIDGQTSKAQRSVPEGQPRSVDREEAERREPVRAAAGNAVEILPPKRITPLYSKLNPIPLIQNFQDDLRLDGAVNVRFANQLIGILVLAIVFIGTVVVAGMLWHSPTLAPQIQTANKSPDTKETTARQSSANDAKQSTPNEVKPGSPNDVTSASPTATKQASVGEETAAQKDDTPKVTFPLPASYGIYALSENKLTELEPLPINVPDPRVELSAEIKTPSTATISNDKPAFIIFRRDILNNAPQKIILRVVARIVREAKIVDGKAVVTNIEGAWRIRSVSRELKVSPVPGQREMIIARPDDNERLAAGRYILVLNRIGYDFTIEGSVKSAEFCLEGFALPTGSLFNQCRAP